MPNLPKYKNIKTMYTIHNLQYQGIFGREILGDVLDIDFKYFNNGDIEYHGNINNLDHLHLEVYL